MVVVNLHDAKAKLSQLVAAAERGEEVVMQGEIELGPRFDAPLPEFDDYTS